MNAYNPLTILVVEDQALVAMQLSFLIEDAGHSVCGWATDLKEALAISQSVAVDLAFVDVHLADGPTGVDLAAHLATLNVPVVFMTANAKRVPADFVGAIGILAKPFTAASVASALVFLHEGMRDPPPKTHPIGLRLSPTYEERWIA